jgi:hypothetical protein
MDVRYVLVRTVSDGRGRYIRNYMPHRAGGQHVGFEWQMQASYREWHALHLAGRLNPVQDRFFQPKPFEELYDLKADPDEVNNLIGQARAARAAVRLRTALDRHMLAVNDNGFLPEGAPGEGYFETRDRKAYPLDSLMRIASAAARREPRNVTRFRTLLASPVASVRYWAALGLLMLGKGAAPARSELERVLRSDPVDQVRVLAGEALVEVGDPAEAVATLARLADDPNTLPVRLQAFNALTCIGAAALPALPVIRKAARRPGQFDYLARLGSYLEAVLTGSYDPRKDSISPEGCSAFNRSAPSFMGPAPSAGWTR